MKHSGIGVRKKTPNTTRIIDLENRTRSPASEDKIKTDMHKMLGDLYYFKASYKLAVPKEFL